MSCPFYNASLVPVRGESSAAQIAGYSVVAGPGLSNQCALITTVHSPCWMEVAESRPPDWAACPRNPEYAPAHVADKACDVKNRIWRHSDFVNDILRARAACEDAARKADA